MYTRKQRIRKTILDILLELVALIALAAFLLSLQSSMTVKRQQSNSASKLAIAEQRMTQNAQQAQTDRESYDAFSQAKLDTIAYFLDRNPGFAGDLNALAEQWGLKGLYIYNAQNQLLRSSNASIEPDAAILDTLEKDVVAADDGVYSYYAADMNTNRLVGARESSAEQGQLATLVSPAYALGTIRAGTNGFIVAISRTDGTIAYHRDMDLIGRDAAELGFTPKVLRDGYNGWARIDGVEYACETTLYCDDYAFVAIVPRSELLATSRNSVIAALTVFGIILSLIIIYVYFLRSNAAGDDTSGANYLPLGKNLYLNRAMGSKVRNLIIFGLIAIFGVTWYAEALVSLTRQSVLLDTKLEAVADTIVANDGRVNDLVAEYDEEYARRAQNLAWLMEKDPTLVDNEALKSLSDAIQVRDIYVFNAAGHTVATNTVYTDFALSNSPADQSYPFWNVIKGYQDVLVQEARADDTVAHKLNQYVGVKRLDDAGMVQIGVSPARLKSRLEATQIDYVLNSIAVANNGILFALDKAEHTLISAPDARWLGKTAAEYGLSETALTDGYTGYQTIDARQMFLSCLEINDMLLYVAVPVSTVLADCLPTALAVAAASLLVMLILAAFILITRGKQPQDADADASAKAGNDVKRGKSFFNIALNGRERRTQSAASRWSSESSLPWSECSPEQKLLKVVLAALGILGAVLVVYMLRNASHGYDRGSILSYIISRRWERVPSLFSFSYIVMLLIEITMLTWLVRKVLVLMMRNFGTRAETVGRMLDSFIKYIAVLGGLMYCLQYLGLDSSAILASAGILTLVIGLGAQSLIKDILAGLFIVFEGEFRVGDIVTVNSWVGTVLEIGIRTTKIMDRSQNIKIFNNADISGVVNMTKQFSFATCTFGIEYGESLERVETILERELPLIGQRNHDLIIAGPFYRGVTELAESSVNLSIVAQCRESDRVMLSRALNREIKLTCDHNNINIPFPQVVLNQPVEFKKATRREKLEAEQFAEEQAKLAQEIGDDKTN